MADMYEDFDENNDLAENDEEYAALGSILSWDDEDDNGPPMPGVTSTVGNGAHSSVLAALRGDRDSSHVSGNCSALPDLVQFSTPKDGGRGGSDNNGSAAPELSFLSYANLASLSSRPGGLLSSPVQDGASATPKMSSSSAPQQQLITNTTVGANTSGPTNQTGAPSSTGLGTNSQQQAVANSSNNNNHPNSFMIQLPFPTHLNVGQIQQQQQQQQGTVQIQFQQAPQQKQAPQLQSQQQPQQAQIVIPQQQIQGFNPQQIAQFLSQHAAQLLQQQQQQQPQQQQQQQPQMQQQQQQQQQHQQQQQQQQMQQQQQQQQQPVQLPFTSDPNAFLQQLQFAQLQQQFQVAQQQAQAAQQQQQQVAAQAAAQQQQVMTMSKPTPLIPKSPHHTSTAPVAAIAPTPTTNQSTISIQEQLRQQFVQAQKQAAVTTAKNTSTTLSSTKAPPAKKQKVSGKKADADSKKSAAVSAAAASGHQSPAPPSNRASKAPDSALSASQIVSASDTDGELSRKQSKKSAPGGASAAKKAAMSSSKSTSDNTDSASISNLDLSHLSSDDKAKVNRDRNREHARNTRLRKKAYLEKLKTTVDELCRERDTLVSERAGAANLLVEMHNTRTEVLMSFFALRSTNEKRRKLWASILDESCFACVMPVTPYRSFPSSEVQVSKCQRTILGIDGMIADTSSLHVLFDSLVDRSRCPLGKIDFRYTLVTEEAVVAGNHMMARWVMTTTNAVQQGAKMEVSKQGMLCCRFNSVHKIIGLELMFDVMAFMLQLKQAAGTDGFSVIPNTVQTCQRTFEKPVVMILAEAPYTIVQVNKLWEQMTGYTAEEVVGKASCGILQGAKTDQKVLEDMMQEIRFKRPTTSILQNFKKCGSAFRNFLLLFPLSTDSRITHYLGITDHVDDGTAPSNIIEAAVATPQVIQPPSLPANAFTSLQAVAGAVGQIHQPTALPPGIVLPSMSGLIQQQGPQHGPLNHAFAATAQTAFTMQQGVNASSVTTTPVPPKQAQAPNQAQVGAVTNSNSVNQEAGAQHTSKQQTAV